jgi:hypothetical protein
MAKGFHNKVNQSVYQEPNAPKAQMATDLSRLAIPIADQTYWRPITQLG